MPNDCVMCGKTRLLESIRMERSMLLELYKMVEVDDR